MLRNGKASRLGQSMRESPVTHIVTRGRWRVLLDNATWRPRMRLL